MSQKRTIASIEAEMTKVKADMTKTKDRYERLSAKLRSLQQEKRDREAEQITDAYLKSKKSFEETMTFFQV